MNVCKRTILLIGLGWVMVLLTLTRAHSSSGPTLLGSVDLPGAENVKYPVVIADSTDAIVGGNVREQAMLWQKSATSMDLALGASIGAVPGQPDYANVALAAGSDGTLYATWLDLRDDHSAIVLRRKPVGTTWEAPRTVVPHGPFRVYVALGVATDGRLVVAWSEDARFRYTMSTDGGSSWSAPALIADREALNRPSIAAGADGRLVVAFGSVGRIFLASWNGSGFSTQEIPLPAAGFHADPTVSVGPSGTVYLTWRNVDGGIFMASGQPGGQFSSTRLADGTAYGTVAISADPRENLHVTWIGNPAGVFDLYYAFRPAGGVWQPLVRVPSNGRLFVNAQGAASLPGADQAYGHAVYEQFSGAGLNAGYALFSAAHAAGPAARPVLAGGAAFSADRQVALSFADVSGAPGQVRWRWGAAPVDGADDSGGWQPFAAQLTISAPVSASDCEQLTLFTQVRDAAGMPQFKPGQAQIRLDRAVQAQVGLYNPGTGHSGYTAQPLARLVVDAHNDCSGLTSARLVNGGALPPAAGNQLNAEVTLPAGEGAHTLEVALADAAGNTGVLSGTIILDQTPPQLVVTGTLQLTPDPAATILTTLTISDAQVIDAAPLWGLAVAVSRTPLAEAARDQLHWQAVPFAAAAQPGPAGDGWFAATARLNLAEQLVREELTPGEYVFYLRFLDAAGNPTPQTVETRLSLNEITFPTVILPLVLRS